MQVVIARQLLDLIDRGRASKTKAPEGLRSLVTKLAPADAATLALDAIMAVGAKPESAVQTSSAQSRCDPTLRS